jgi:hypothetical protein
MANAVTVNNYENNGSERKNYCTITLSGSYSSANGEVITKGKLGLNQISKVEFVEGFPDYMFGTQVASDGSAATLRVYAVDVPVSSTPALVYNDNVTQATPESNLALYINPLAGTFQVGETITGGTSTETAVIAAIDTDAAGNDRLLVNTASGPLDAAETVTGGTSGATATTLDTLHVRWDLDGSLASPLATAEADGNTQKLTSSGILGPVITTNQYRYDPSQGMMETLLSDAFTDVSASGTSVATGTFTSLPELINGATLSGTFKLIAYGK